MATRHSTILAPALLVSWLVVAGCGEATPATPDVAADTGVDAPEVDDARDEQEVAPTDASPPGDLPPIDAPAIDAPAIDAPAIDAPPTDLPTDAEAGDRPDAVDAGPPTPDLGTLAPNALCERAVTLNDAVPLDAEDLAMASTRAEGCFAVVTGPSLYYRVTVASFDSLAVTVTPRSDGASFRPAVRFMPACAIDRCVTQSVGETSGGTTRWINYSDQAQTIVVAVSNLLDLAAGRYRIEASVGRGRGNATCSRATVVSPGSTLRDQTFGDANDVLPLCAGSMLPAAGPSLYYRVTVSPGEVLQATTRPLATNASAPVLRLLDACDNPLCLANSGRQAAEGNLLHWVNEGTSARTVLVAAGAYPATATATHFDISFATLARPTNVTCAAASALEGSMPSVEGSTALAATAPPLCADAVTSGAALWYRVTVPAGRVLSARARRLVGSVDPMVRIYGACGGQCLVPTARAQVGVAAALWLNSGGADAPAYVAVSAAPSSATSFELHAAFSTAAPNAACAAAAEVTAPALLPTEPLEGAFELPPACTGVGTPAPSLWYRVRVPGGRALAVSASRVMSNDGFEWSPTLRVLAACGATARCNAVSTPGTEPYTAHAIYQAGVADEDVYVAVGSSVASVGGAVAMRFSLPSPPANLTCDAAIDLGATTRREAEFIGGGGAVRSNCSLTASGAALYYRASVPPGATLTAVANRAGGAAWTPVIELSTACTGGACLASGATGTLRWTNAGSTDQEVRLGLFSSTRVAAATASLSVSIESPAYRLERVAGACEEVTPEWAGVGAMNANEAGPLAPLPFAFNYFGEPVTHRSVSVNGFLQLWPSSAGSPDGTGSNTGLRSVMAPRGTVAPFWDTFTVDSFARVASRESTEGGRHLTVAWSNLVQEMTPVSFQAKLFAATDVIEFHYCRLGTGAGGTTSGSSATVGLLDTMGQRAFEQSLNTAGAVATDVAFRFVPIR